MLIISGGFYIFKIRKLARVILAVVKWPANIIPYKHETNLGKHQLIYCSIHFHYKKCFSCNGMHRLVPLSQAWEPIVYHFSGLMTLSYTAVINAVCLSICTTEHRRLLCNLPSFSFKLGIRNGNKARKLPLWNNVTFQECKYVLSLSNSGSWMISAVSFPFTLPPHCFTSCPPVFHKHVGAVEWMVETKTNLNRTCWAKGDCRWMESVQNMDFK